MAVPAVPEGLPQWRWLNGLQGDAKYEAGRDGSGKLLMTAGAQTDWFNPAPVPNSPAALSNAPALVFTPPVGYWQLSARVHVTHTNLFDGGTLFLHQGSDDWCKLCYELSPENK